MKTINYLQLVIAIAFYCMAPQSLNAQDLEGQALADSLLNELPKTKSDTDKVKLLSNLARAFTLFNPPEALNYANKAMDLAKKNKLDKGHRAGTYE